MCRTVVIAHVQVKEANHCEPSSILAILKIKGCVSFLYLQNYNINKIISIQICARPKYVQVEFLAVH